MLPSLLKLPALPEPHKKQVICFAACAQAVAVQESYMVCLRLRLYICTDKSKQGMTLQQSLQVPGNADAFFSNLSGSK
jgi:hypothetical protein